MSDLIDREALLKQIDIDSDGEPGYYGDTWKFIDTIKKIPSALGTNLASLGTDCISRQAAIDEVKQLYEWHDTVTEDRLIDHLKRLPSAQPMRKKGEWVSPFGIGCVCNCCGYDINEHGIDIRVDGEPNFCPNCGAKMEETE